MKRETLEKIRNILEHLFELFIFILIMLITFGSLHVHAATVTPTGNIICEVEGSINDFCNQNLKVYSGNCNTLQCAIFVRNDSHDFHDYDAIFYTTDVTSDFVYYSVDSKTWPKNPQNDSYNVYPIKSSGMSTVVLSDGTSVRYSLGGMGNDSYTILSSTPCYDPISGVNSLTSNESAKIVLEHLLVTGDLVPNNGGSIDNPDFEDTAYAFTGFTANNKMTATWTGTTERTYLQDQDVEEYVRVNYYFADKEAQDTIKQADAYPDEFATADKTLTIDVSGLKPDDENWFLRYIRITPCYRQAGLGAWGDFYHGVDCKVYFNQDGSIDKIVRDFPQGSGDYSYKHIFTSDKYSTDIPAPELSAISHNGFTLLNNSNNDYYVDIILESNLYGVKMEKNAGTWLPVVDIDWVYNSHYYNFADTSQIAINNDVIYIPNLFSVNPESDLVDDFKKWSLEYSSYSSLPSMSFLKRSTAARTRYVDQFLFKDDSKFSDSEQLKFSHMAESVFYVRYYNKSMIYGPWVRYKFRDGYVAQVIDGTLGGAYIDVGQVDTDDSGNVRVDEKGDPIVSDNVSGRQDYDTGESDFSDGSFSLDLSDVTKFFDYLKKIFESVTGALSSFGSVVAACFGFLPGELINALIFGICVMMFIGIIKAVKG